MSMHTPYQEHIWVTKEIIRREYLQNIEDGIYQEQLDAEAAETALENALDIEEQRAKLKETEIANNLSQEISRATLAEQAITQGIQDDLDELSDRISEEYIRAIVVETTLEGSIIQNTTDISAERTRAINAEQALQNDIDTKIAGAYKPSGSIYFADLPSLTVENQGRVYYILDAFTTTSDFIEGAGVSCPAGTYVGIIDAGTGSTHDYKYDAMSGMVDLTTYVQKTDIATPSALGISKPDGTTVTIDNDGTLHVRSGHEIVNSSGTAVRQRSKLKFLNATVTDDAENDQTIVTPTGSQITVDQTVTQGSANPVSGGAVYTYIDTMITQAINGSY